jgi:hypothetical protein
VDDPAKLRRKLEEMGAMDITHMDITHLEKTEDARREIPERGLAES